MLTNFGLVPSITLSIASNIILAVGIIDAINPFVVITGPSLVIGNPPMSDSENSHRLWFTLVIL